jgi:hypothetical protein
LRLARSVATLPRMTILRAPVAWSRPKKPRGPDLSQEERQHVKVALAFMLKRIGTWKAVADAMGLKKATVRLAASKRGGVTAGVALRAARAAGVPVEDILSGAFPKPGMCPHCGRG